MEIAREWPLAPFRAAGCFGAGGMAADRAQPGDAEIIIIGGGIVGCSIAYHLARLGRKDVLLLEKSGLTHGSTWHAVGMIGQLRSHRNYTRMNSRSFDLYSRIEAETGLSADWRQTGSIRIASSEERWREIRRQATQAKAFGFEIELLSAREVVEKCPIVTGQGIVGAAYMPTDGSVDPSGVTLAVARGARMRGARLIEGVTVEDITVEGRRATAVVTNAGTFRCDTLVCAAGMWSNRVGAMAGVSVPSGSVLHQYLVTEPVKDISRNLPGFRDPDNLFYLKPEAGGRLVMGGFESRTSYFDPPPEFGRELLPADFDRIEELVQLSMPRVPLLGEVGVQTLINGPIPVSPDGLPVLGRAPELDNFYVACGFTAGIASGGGAGEVLAEWIVEGQPPFDLWPLDIRRFPPQHGRQAFLRERTVEVHTSYYRLQGPAFEYQTARPARLSPLYPVLKARGAVFGSKFGWERPNWFAPDGAVSPSDMAARVEREHQAVRERVALIDQTSFAKLEIAGLGATAALQRICANDIDRPVGALVYTQLCNESGGIEADLTVARLAADRFYLVTGTGFPLHDFGWIREHLPADGGVVMTDVTASWAVLNLCGPRAREVLQGATSDDVGSRSFPYMTWRKLTLGLATVRSLRAGFVGELGWELHIPSEYAAHVYELLHAAGAAHGIADAGYRAIESLRLEKGYRVWGTDLTTEVNPFEAGLGPFVKLAKGDFIGREALARAKANGPAQTLACFALDAPADVRGGEAILGDGRLLGHATSGGFGYTVQKPIVLGYVPANGANARAYAVEAEGTVVPATRHVRALYDPENLRLRA